MSRSKICHDESSPSYSRTKHFTGFDTIELCLEDGGRLPKGEAGYEAHSFLLSRERSHKGERLKPVSGSTYDRSKFAHWIDVDGDCLNTRHELLIKLSTSAVEYSDSHCLVTRGRWNDPYTGKVFFNARELDVDHLVPLKWAWEHGANIWSNEKRRQLANDERNLFVVEASTNREKGARGPLEWLPPNQKFRCQYILRFQRVARGYGLSFSQQEAERIDNVRQTYCGK